MAQEKNQVILALDLGTKTGYALQHPWGLTSGQKDFSPSRFSDQWCMRFRWFCENLLDVVLCDYGRLDQIVYEEVRGHRGTDAAHCYGGFLATLHLWCLDNTVAFASVPVGTIKRHATGKGNASKDQMMAAAARQWPDRTIRSTDEADALWILDYWLRGRKKSL